MSRLVYLDSSAIVKLVVREPESEALTAALGAWPSRVTSVLAQVEVQRAVRRAGAKLTVRRRAERVLDRLNLVRVDDDIVRRAVDLTPPELGSLDSIHLATALSLGGALEALIAYDQRLASAARHAGLTVWAPA